MAYQREIRESVANTNRDPHLLFSQVGRALGLIPEARVREAFLSIWVRHYPAEANAIASKFFSMIPRESPSVSMARMPAPSA